MIVTRVEIAPGANPAADPSTFAWESAGRRRTSAPIAITAGRDDEAEHVEAGSLAATFDDRDGNLSTRNVLGKWYGKLSRGTPLRVVLDRAQDDFNRTAVASGYGTSAQGFQWLEIFTGYTSTDGTRAVFSSTAVNVAGANLLQNAGSNDIEMTWSTQIVAMPTGGNFRSGAIVRYTNGSNYIRTFVEFKPDGNISIWAQRANGGVTQQLYASTNTGLTYEPFNTIITKLRADGPYIMIKCWHIGLDEPAEWHAVFTDDTQDGGFAGLMQWRANTNAGAYTAYVDNVTFSAIRWQGTVPEWPVRWPDKSGADSTTPITAGGVLRRLAQGSSPLKSPLTHQLIGQAPFSYFTLEEPSGATSAASTVSRQAPAVVTDVTFAGDDTLNGALTTAVLNTAASSRIAGKVAPRNTPDGYACMWFFKLASLSAGEMPMMEIRCSGTVTRWVIYVNGTTCGIRGYDRDNNSVVDTAATFGVDPTQWTAIQLETNVSGGTVNWALITHQVGSATFYASSGNYSGSATRADSFTLTAPTDSMSAGHLWFGDNDLPFVDGTFALVADGYRGEQAAERIKRLCAENGVPVWALSGSTEPMGRQRAAKLVDLLRECEAADLGLLYERGLSLAYIPRVRRYNAGIMMSLTWKGLFDEPPEPADDDQRLRNQWTVSRTDGSSATAADQDSINSNGLYDDATEINIESDDRLPDFAGWLTSLGTADYLRWPRIKINLLKHPELIGPWLRCRVGSRITIADPPSQIAGEVIDLVIDGYNETINVYEWTIELACSPASPWQIGTYDNAGRLYDVDSVVLIDLDADDTWAPIENADLLGSWSVGDVPYPILAAGQHNNVIGMSRFHSIAVADGTFAAGQPGTDGWYVAGGSSGTPGTDADRAYGYGPCATATVAGSPSQIVIRNGSYRPAAAPGQTFEASAAIKRSTAGNVTLTIDYLDSGGAWFASSTATVAVAAGAWTYVSVTGTAPSGTAMLEYGPTISGSPANGVVLKVHNIDILRTDSLNRRQLATLERGTDGFVKDMPAGSSFRVAVPARYGV